MTENYSTDPAALEATIDLGPDDFAAMSEALLMRSEIREARVMGEAVQLAMFGAIILVCLFVIGYFVDRLPVPDVFADARIWTEFGIIMAVFFVFSVISLLFPGRAIREATRYYAGRVATLETSRLRVDGKGISLRRPGVVAHYEWSVFKGYYDAPRHVLLPLHNLVMVVIPKRNLTAEQGAILMTYVQRNTRRIDPVVGMDGQTTPGQPG